MTRWCSANSAASSRSMARSRSTSPVRSTPRPHAEDISALSAGKWILSVPPTAPRMGVRSSRCNRPIANAPVRASSLSSPTGSSRRRAPRPTSWSPSMASRNGAPARSLNESVRLSQSPTRPSAPNWKRRANGWCKAGAAASRFEAASAPLSFEDDLTGVPPRQQRRQRLAGLGQRKNFRDQRLDPAGLPPAQQLGEVAADQGGVAFGLPAPDDADDRDVLDQIGRDRLDAARGKADHQHPRLPVDRAQRLVERIAADRVVNDIGALAAGQRAHPVANAFRLVVDQLVGSPRARHR